MLLTTDMDHRKFRLEQAYNQSLSQKSLDQRQQGQATSGSGAGDDSLGSSRLSRGDPRGAGMQAVAGIYRVLQASFTPDMLQGFGEVKPAGLD